jgi:hypothetical protein
MSQIESPSSIKSKERANYYKELKRLKDGQANELDSQKKRYEKVTTQRQEDFRKDISKIEDSYESKFDDMRKKSSEEMKKYQSKVDAKTSKVQEENLRELAKERENFQKRVEDLNLEYKKDLTAKGERSQVIQDETKKRYQENLLKKDETFANESNNVRSRQDHHTKELLGHSHIEKKELEKKHAEIMQNQLKDEMKKRQVEKDTASSVLEKTQHDNKIALKLKDIERNAQVDDIRNETQEVLEKRMLDEKINHEKMITSHERDVANERKLHLRQQNQSNMDHLMEKRIMNYQEGRRSESLQRSQNNGISVTPKEKQQEVEIRRWKERNREMEGKLGEQQDKYVDNLKEVQQKNKMEAGRALQSKEVESDNRVLDVLAGERMKFTKAQSTWNDKQLADKEIFERTNTKNDKQHKDRITTLNEAYTQRLQDLNDKNTNLLEGLKREHLHDKREFSVNLETQFNQRQISMVKDFEKKQDLLLGEYEKKLKHLESQNEQLMMKMHETIGRVRREGDQKMINQQGMLVEQKKDSERSLHEMMATRENELRQTIYDLHEGYQARINNQENDFRIRMNELTNSYEQKLFTLQRETNQELNSKNNEMTRERKILHAAFEDDKKRLTEQYENMIKNMKSAHQGHVANLNSFKKINSKLEA